MKSLSAHLFKPLPGLLKLLTAGAALTLWIYWLLAMDTLQAQHLDDRTNSDESMAGRLEGHVRILASEIGERNIWQPEKLARAAGYIEESWTNQGYAVKAQEYKVEGISSRNLEVEIPGSHHPEQIILIGAHYDSVAGCPGANDNGSGVAALLELSRLVIAKKPRVTIRLVAFVNEEPPFFLSRRMGSRVYAGRSRKNNEQIIAMISLETIGYYSDRPHSQQYPFPLGFFYPDRANFIGFVSNLGSRKLLNRAADTFCKNSAFPLQRVAAPFWMTGIGWSDHWSFWREGFPAIMVTDTAFFRYAHYHQSTDTPDKLVYDQMAIVVDGLYRMIEELAEVPAS